MKYSSQQLGKILKKTEDELNSVMVNEFHSKAYVCSVNEDPATCRPEYDFIAVQKLKDELACKVRKIKHALNAFNISTVVPGFDMTVDQILIYIPQLSKLKSLYGDMRTKLPKVRVVKTSQIIDYEYINYDLKEVSAKYEDVSELLSAAQIALDKVNAAEVIEIDLG